MARMSRRFTLLFPRPVRPTPQFSGRAPTCPAHRRVTVSCNCLFGGWHQLTSSAEKASMGILRDERAKVLDRGYLRRRIIAVPLKVATHPEYPPHSTATHKRCLGGGAFALLTGLASPHRPDLEDLNALPSDTKTKIHLCANVRRGPVLSHERIQSLPNTSRLEYQSAITISPNARHKRRAARACRRRVRVGRPS